MKEPTDQLLRVNMRRLRAGGDLGASHLAVGPGPVSSLSALSRALESAVASALFLDDVLLVFHVHLRPLPLSQWSMAELPEPSATAEAVAERCGQIHGGFVFHATSDRVLGFAAGLGGRDEADRLTTQLLLGFRQAVTVEGSLIHFDVRIGSAVMNDDTADALELQEAAHIALKQTDATTPLLAYTPHLAAESSRAEQLRADLDEIVANGELDVVFQPILDLAERRVSGFEAFVRWNHPEAGTLPPADFLGLAESTAQIYAIGDWVLSTAFDTVAEWVRLGLVGDVTLWVNVTAVEVLRVGFKQRVREIIAGAPAVSLGLDLPEGSAAGEKTVCDVIRSLALDDVRAALDGFGRQNSNLTGLAQLPYDTVKLSQELVSRVATDDLSEDAIALLVKMAHGSGLQVIATGVESSDQLDSLRAHGIDAIQGFLATRPLTADEMAERLRSTEWAGGRQGVD